MYDKIARCYTFERKWNGGVIGVSTNGCMGIVIDRTTLAWEIGTPRGLILTIGLVFLRFYLVVRCPLIKRVGYRSFLDAAAFERLPANHGEVCRYIRETLVHTLSETEKLLQVRMELSFAAAAAAAEARMKGKKGEG